MSKFCNLNDDVFNNNNNDSTNNDCFYESLDRILSSTTCSSSSCSDDDVDSDVCVTDLNFSRNGSVSVPRVPMGDYDVWISQPSSVEERRLRLLRRMGLAGEKHVDSSSADLKLGKSISADHLDVVHVNRVHNVDNVDRVSDCKPVIVRSKSADHERRESVCVSDCDDVKPKPNCDDDVDEDAVCTIKNLDNGKEFVVKEVREDGMCGNLKEVGTGKQLTMEEFEMCVGHSPIVQELMRRHNFETGGVELPDVGGNNSGGSGSKLKKKGSWLKSIKNVASSVTGHKERRSSDERDTSSEKGGRRSSSATDDSQDGSFHGPERVRVRQYGKSCKDLSALFKSQEIQAHNGSIWTIKFSLDGKYLASAGEDCLIHVWEVGSSERKGDLLFDKQEDGNLNVLLMSNGSPEPTSLSTNLENVPERKRRGRLSISRKSISMDPIVVPDTVFALSEKPICSFNGHSEDVLDLSWSKSQHLLSSSMDKTVRLWQLSSKSCLKIFSHSDYVTCIQFNPVDDRYFISGSLDSKVRIWSIPDRQVVDWNDLHEMITAACYTPDGQAALVGSYKGSCHLYNTTDNRLQQKSQINLQNKKKKPHHKKITGFQFAPGSKSEVLITSADSRIRVVDGVDLVHKFKGFRNTNSQISACVSANGRYVVCASEDSNVYVWKHEADSRASRNKGVTVTQSYEHFHCQDVSMAIPWPGISDTCWGFGLTDPARLSGDHERLDEEASTANHPPTPEDETNRIDGSLVSSPLHGTISSATNGYFFDRISATFPEEKLVMASTKNRSPRTSVDFSNGLNAGKSAWGMVIVTAGLRGEIRTFQNFGMPVRI
ncbi:putative transcription factor WD40-like family [Helianthus annuus]|nr:putative transcription factor WD40-like family [Helianthus annuus]